MGSGPQLKNKEVIVATHKDTQHGRDHRSLHGAHTHGPPVHNWRESLGAALIRASLWYSPLSLSLSASSQPWQRDPDEPLPHPSTHTGAHTLTTAGLSASFYWLFMTSGNWLEMVHLQG